MYLMIGASLRCQNAVIAYSHLLGVLTTIYENLNLNHQTCIRNRHTLNRFKDTEMYFKQDGLQKYSSYCILSLSFKLEGRLAMKIIKLAIKTLKDSKNCQQIVAVLIIKYEKKKQ